MLPLMGFVIALIDRIHHYSLIQTFTYANEYLVAVATGIRISEDLLYS